ncbi:Gfo/Idh/MocA family protein, partial [Pseudomonas syringae group genomosp. 7]|uniref:Gfo/Idh/MocA family protein n=1 Tax=Pseudomonas syringae group genomosp. 7 TaxID=251699 RepID=UPI00377031FC
DFMGNPSSPCSWRCDAAHAGGGLADLGSHLLALARDLLGDVQEVCADASTDLRQRHASTGSHEMLSIAVDDQTHSL